MKAISKAKRAHLLAVVRQMPRVEMCAHCERRPAHRFDGWQYSSGSCLPCWRAEDAREQEWCARRSIGV